MPATRNVEPDPERDWVTIEREHLGILLAASLAVLEHLSQDHPTAKQTWTLATACSAAERALLGDTTTPAPEHGGGR